ncbi:MAG: hypothetical protein ACRD3W_14330, partial [Terriglobales bacterium]
PVLLMAGKAPYTASNELVGSRDTYVHFVQEPTDQGSLVRPYMKWEWTLPSGVVVKEALRRAYSIMQSEPRGPVYLMMQRETLTQHWSGDDVRSYSAEHISSTSGGQADPKLIGELADRLLKAEHPVLLTAYAGRNPRAVEAISELSELAGIAVFESNMTTNIPTTMPCFLGHSADKQVPMADLGILVDIDVPWFPSDVQPKAHSFWAHIDIDILKQASPMWTFPGNMRVQGDSGHILTQLLDELKKKATPAFKQKAAARVIELKKQHDALSERAAKLAAEKGTKNEINPHYLMAELNKLLDPKDVVFNEAIRNTGAVSMQIKRPLPNTMLSS